MSEQDRKFGQWFRNFLTSEGMPLLCRESAKRGYNAATAEANKRIEALEGEVAELNMRIIMRQKMLDETYDKVKPLVAHINDLREALEEMVDAFKHMQTAFNDCVFDKARKALSATPAESLQAHERLIEDAKVAVNDLRELAGDCNCNDDYAKRLEEAIKSYEVK